jgi:DNA (cytosine-5)-methyltransferase 1
VVYNQCSNLVLREAIRAHAGHEVERLKKIHLLGNDDGEDIAEDPYIPAPPKPEEIDCIIAGFPWSVRVYCDTLVDHTDIPT